MLTPHKKTAYQLERHFKGVANHHRIAILALIAQQPEINLENLSQQLGANPKTISEHTRRLVQAGLVNKKHFGRMVIHTLSPYGQRFYQFIKTF